MSASRFDLVRRLVERDSPYRVDKEALRRLLAGVPRARRKHRQEQIRELAERCALPSSSPHPLRRDPEPR